MVDGKFVDDEGKELKGSEVVSVLLGRCLQWSDIVLERYTSHAPTYFAISLTLSLEKG